MKSFTFIENWYNAYCSPRKAAFVPGQKMVEGQSILLHLSLPPIPQICFLSYPSVPACVCYSALLSLDQEKFKYHIIEKKRTFFKIL